MTPQERELHVNRIVSGCIRCKIHNRKGDLIRLLLKSPTRYQKYLAEEVYQETLRESQFEGLKSESEVIDMMISQGLWTLEKQTKLDTLPKDLEELKVKMYQLTFKSDERRIVKKLSKTIKEDIAKLHEERNAFAYLSAEGTAYLAKVRYTVAMSLYRMNGKPFFHEENYWDSSGHIVEEALEFYNQHRLSEETYRILARKDPWRTLWSMRKTDGLFNIPAVDLTEEQKALVVWANVYDSVYQHPECPPDTVVEDDDLLDGWMIIQRRKRTSDIEKTKIEDAVTNEKIRNSDEVYVLAGTKEDAAKVDELNDPVAKMTKRQRLAYVQKRGEVNEVEMPDTKLKIQQEWNKRYGDSVKAGQE